MKRICRLCENEYPLSKKYFPWVYNPADKGLPKKERRIYFRLDCKRCLNKKEYQKKKHKPKSEKRKAYLRKYQREWAARKRAEFLSNKKCDNCESQSNLSFLSLPKGEKIHALRPWQRKDLSPNSYLTLCITCKDKTLSGRLSHIQKERWQSGVFDYLGELISKKWKDGDYESVPEKVAENWQKGIYDHITPWLHNNRKGHWSSSIPFESTPPTNPEFSTAEGYEQLLLVYEATKRFPPVIRDDMCQEMLLDLVEGLLKPEDIETRLGEYKSRAWKGMPKYAEISINQPKYKDGPDLEETLKQ